MKHLNHIKLFNESVDYLYKDISGNFGEYIKNHKEDYITTGEKNKIDSLFDYSKSKLYDRSRSIQMKSDSHSSLFIYKFEDDWWVIYNYISGIGSQYFLCDTIEGIKNFTENETY